MRRVLGEIPHVSKFNWNWNRSIAKLRFDGRKSPSEAVIRDRIDEGTMFTVGEVKFLYTKEELPDEIR